jgi:uncharacterized OB-fold protein
MAAWRGKGTWRRKNTAAAESKATDLHPACPRCGDLLAPGSAYCAECGCAVTVQRSVGTVDEPAGDEAA